MNSFLKYFYMYLWWRHIQRNLVQSLTQPLLTHSAYYSFPQKCRMSVALPISFFVSKPYFLLEEHTTCVFSLFHENKLHLSTEHDIVAFFQTSANCVKSRHHSSNTKKKPFWGFIYSFVLNDDVIDHKDHQSAPWESFSLCR